MAKKKDRFAFLGKSKEFLLWLLAPVSSALVMFIFVVLISSQVADKIPGARDITTKRGEGKPSLYLTTPTEKTVYTEGETIPIIVLADSGGRVVSGFDIVLQYDSQKLSFIEAGGLLDGFQIFSTTEGGKVLTTGVKRLDIEDEVMFSQTPVVEAVFLAKEKGESTLKFDFDLGRTDESNLIDKASRDVLADVRGLTITVGEVLEVTGEKPVFVPESSIRIRLVDVNVPDEACRDCLTTATVEVEKDGRMEELEFREGGFAGIVEEEKQAFGYTFKLKNLTENKAEIVYVKK